VAVIANPYEQFLPPGMTPEQAARFLPPQQPNPNDLYNTDAVAPPVVPDERLASNGPIIAAPSPELQQLANQTAAAQSNPDETPALNSDQRIRQQLGMPPVAPQQAAPAGPPVNPADLVGPGQAAGEAAGKTRTPMDNAYFADLLQASRGTPGRVVKGGPTLAKETWEQTGVRPIPGMTQATDPETGKPLFQKVGGKRLPLMVEEIGRGGPDEEQDINNFMMPGYEAKREPEPYTEPEMVGFKQRGGKMAPVMESNAEQFHSREQTEKAAQAEVEAQQQGGMRREAGRELYAGDYLRQEVEADRQRMEEAYQRHEEQMKLREQVIRQTLASLPQMAQKYSPDTDTQSRLGLGIAQGMLWMGAALAGQQPPHINMMQDAIDNDLKRQQMQMQKGFGKINALGQLTQQLGDPLAAAHAFQAMRWANVERGLEGMAHRGAGGRMSDNAQTMYKQAQAMRAEHEKMAYGGAYQKVIATQPDQYVPGRAGGLPAVIAEVVRQHGGTPKNPYASAPKETVDAAVNQALQEYKEGKPFTFPGAAQPALTTGSERHSQFNTQTAVSVPEWMGTGQAHVWARSPKEAEDTANAVELVEGVLHTIHATKDLANQFGSSWTPTQRAKITTNLTMESHKIARAIGVNTTDKSADEIWHMIGADVALGRISPANFNEISDNLEHNLIVFGRALGHAHQLTTVPRGQETGEGYAVPQK
jgi:hypothetical protein